MQKKIKNGFDILFKHFGPQEWWPGDTPFEVMVGAILTQNTNWGNVEKAINNLKKEKVLSAKAIYDMHPATLAKLIRPAGYYNIKAKRLKNFIKKYVDEFDGSVKKLGGLGREEAREWLLSVNGIGPETADSILLYALEKPSFVIDAYTKRVLERHNMVPEEVSYHDVQELFMDNLETDTALFNEYHALIVRLCKEYCKKNPLCETCPLKDW